MNKFFIEVIHEGELQEESLLSVVAGVSSECGDVALCNMNCPTLHSCQCYGKNLVLPPNCPKLINVEL